MRFSVSGTMNMTWDEIRDAVVTAESLGFDEYYASDHLMAVAGFDADKALLDAMAVLAAVAPFTRSIRLGCLVSPVTYREPVILARQLQTIDLITHGRAIAGIGAGWSATEHTAFGLAFPPIGARLALLETACERLRSLWPELRPRPVQPHVRMLIAGASPRLVRMSVRYADAWLAVGTPAYLAQKVAEIDKLGPDIERTVDAPLEICVSMITALSEDTKALVAIRERMAAATPTAERAQRESSLPGENRTSVFVGHPAELAAEIERYRTSGVDRVILSVPRPYSRRALEELAHAARGA